MKFIKEDGTIEDGTPLTDEQARIQSVLHEIVCRYSTHYGFQGIPKCAKVALLVGPFMPLLDALEELANPRPTPAPEPQPVMEASPEPVPAVPAAPEESELSF